MQESLGCQGVGFIIDHWAPEEFESLLSGIKKDVDWEDADENLIEKLLCSECPYVEEDCDYRDPDAPDDAKPCGGYLVLCMMAASGVKEVIDILNKS